MTPAVKQFLQQLIADAPPETNMPLTPITVDASLDFDLKDAYNAGWRQDALLIQIIRELRKFNKDQPTPAPATPAAPAIQTL